MKSSLAILLLVVMGCSSRPVAVHPLDGKSVVLEGHWNTLAKDVDHLATPKNEQFVRVTAVLHWRGMDPAERRLLAAQAVQLIPDGYIIRWPEARWEAVN